MVLLVRNVGGLEDGGVSVRVPRAPKLGDRPDIARRIWQVRELAAHDTGVARFHRAVLLAAAVFGVLGVVLLLLSASIALDPENPVSQLVLRLFASGGE